MFCKREFYVARVSRLAVEMQQVHCPPSLEERDYRYAGFSMNELVVLARESEGALFAAHGKALGLIGPISVSCARKFGCELSEIFAKIEETFYVATRKFDPAKGDFCHFFRRMAKLTASNFYKTLANRRRREVLFGSLRLHDADAVLTIKDGGDGKEELAFRLDLESYRKELSGQERRILTLYDSRATYREIAKATSLSASAIADKIQTMVEELKRRHEKKLI